MKTSVKLELMENFNLAPSSVFSMKVMLGISIILFSLSAFCIDSERACQIDTDCVVVQKPCSGSESYNTNSAPKYIKLYGGASLANCAFVAREMTTYEAICNKGSCEAHPEVLSFIIDSKKSGQLFRQCSRQSPSFESLWNPNMKDIESLENQFGSCVSHKIVNQFDLYMRQYAGFIRKGQKFIYLNAVLKENTVRSQREKPLVLCDGDGKSFGVEYNLTIKKFQNFEFNGPSTAKVDSRSLEECSLKKRNK